MAEIPASPRSHRRRQNSKESEGPDAEETVSAFAWIPGCAVSRSRCCGGRWPRHATLVRRCRHAPLPHGLHVFCVVEHEDKKSMEYALLHCAPPVHMVPFPQITAQKLFPFVSWTQHVLPAQDCDPLQPS